MINIATRQLPCARGSFPDPMEAEYQPDDGQIFNVDSAPVPLAGDPEKIEASQENIFETETE